LHAYRYAAESVVSRSKVIIKKLYLIIEFNINYLEFFKIQNIINKIEEQTEISVTNQGLEISKPIMTLTGNGIIEISINGYAQFQYDFGNDDHVTIDFDLEDAYLGTPLNLKNRQMMGQFPILNPKNNIILWKGTLEKIQIKLNSK
jgi:phage-related protein